MNTDAIVKNIVVPVGAVLLIGIALTSERVQSTILETIVKILDTDNPFRSSDTNMRPYQERDSDYKSARGSFSEGGSTKNKLKTRKR
jgi:hypothetical protein